MSACACFMFLFVRDLCVCVFTGRRDHALEGVIVHASVRVGASVCTDVVFVFRVYSIGCYWAPLRGLKSNGTNSVICVLQGEHP